MLESKQLKSLLLHSVAVSDLFFQELAAVAKLTALDFYNEEEEVSVQSFVSQFHSLEYLEDLELHLKDDSRVWEFLSP